MHGRTVKAPHTLKAQLEATHALEVLILRKRQSEELQNDQSDIDLALDHDDLPLGVDNSWSGNHARLILPIEGSE